MEIYRTLILAPSGRDAIVAKGILQEANLPGQICQDIDDLVSRLKDGETGTAILTQEATYNADVRSLSQWVKSQAAWSDFPFVFLTGHGGGLEKNPQAARYMQLLGNATFLERPFHPTTLISVVKAALRSRSKQHQYRRLTEELESRVTDRTAELAAANHQLRSQIQEREQVEATLRQMQRLEAVGQLTSGVAHDFNNLLTVILGNIIFLEKDFASTSSQKLLQRLANMRMAAERGATLTDQLLSFSRRQLLEPRALNVNESVAQMRGLLKSTLGGSIEFEHELSDDTWPAFSDPTQLGLAILNLAINARDAMDGVGKLSIRTSNIVLGQPSNAIEPAAGEYVMVAVSDTGVGMSDEIQAKAFEPFFTTKGPDKGSGLGLSQILGFAKQSGGGLSLTSRPGKGATISIFLPRFLGENSPCVVSNKSEGYRHFTGSTILLVDDDDAVRDVTAAILKDAGYVVIEAGSGGAALEIIQSGIALDLVLLDYAMPGMNGAELGRQIQLKRPQLPLLFVTGFAEQSALSSVSEAFIVQKPFLDGELIKKIDAVLVKRASKVIRLNRVNE